MKDTFDMAEIIHRYLLGEISEEEQYLLNKWVKQRGRHQEMLREFCDREYWDKSILRHQLFCFDRGYRKFDERRRRVIRRVRRMWVATAVAILSCVVSGTIFLLRSDYQKGNDLVRQEIPIVPGERRAVLILDNGQQVELSKGAIFKIKEKSTVISIEDKYIIYPKEDTSHVEASHRIYTPRGGEYSLELSDGTIVWLNAESELSYPVKFKGDERKVEVKGEAYFEVVKNPDKPFIVKTNGMEIRVLGTSFNVRAYAGEVQQTTLIEGCVEVVYGEQQVKVTPGYQVVLVDNCLEVQKVDTYVCMGWKNGLFVFDDHPLVEVLRELERWYDVQIEVKDEKIKQLKFTSDIPRYKNIRKVLDIIELAVCVSFEVKGRTIVVQR
ncbi:MAG TPA: FecR domain-containing protein [Candidatus Butyricimonas faecavium]|nr:FecR domain-containing protein [Candidatus Butyricimonas faecavium]